MSSLTLYHNPRCSKSRAALALLQQRGIQPDIVLYLQTPPDQATLRQLLQQLALPARTLLRSKEPEYAEAGLSAQSSEADIIAALARYPKLIERPIASNGKRAVIGRPPEQVLTLL